MKKLLTICIPTYKRPESLRKCIESVVTQIELNSDSNSVDILVANDASPDYTNQVILEYEALNYFYSSTRSFNVGMSSNIKLMLEEAARKSDYQLIITDDDFLQPGMLKDTVDFLQQQKMSRLQAPAIWTPRYSYIEDGKLHCVVCDSFGKDEYVPPSSFNMGRYMVNGFILSGLIIKADEVNYDLWTTNEENSFFPIIFFGDLILRKGAFFWKKNVVHHTVLNQCHWERWGKNDVVIEMRLFLDYLDTYAVMASRIYGWMGRLMFYYAAFMSIYRAVDAQLRSEKLINDNSILYDAVWELKKTHSDVAFAVRQQAYFSLIILGIVAVSKSLLLKIILAFSYRGKKDRFFERSKDYMNILRNIPIIARLLSS